MEWCSVSGGAIKKLRRQKIKQQLKEQKAKKVTNELKDGFVNMSDQELDEMSAAIGNILLENSDEVKEEVEEV